MKILPFENHDRPIFQFLKKCWRLGNKPAPWSVITGDNLFIRIGTAPSSEIPCLESRSVIIRAVLRVETNPALNLKHVIVKVKPV